jgi:hypothetical protein
VDSVLVASVLRFLTRTSFSDSIHASWVSPRTLAELLDAGAVNAA